MKTLYEARYEVVAYFLADDDADAARKADNYLVEEVHNSGIDGAVLARVETKRHPVEWPRNCLVYGADDDTTLGAVMEALP